MIFSRRHFLAMAGSCIAFSAQAAPRGLDKPVDIGIISTPIDVLQPSNPSRTRFGSLTFRSGLQLTSSYAEFGGFSGLSRAENGQLVAVSDLAQWLLARPVYENEKLTGLSQASMAPVLNVQGRPMRSTKYYDTESLCIVNGVAYIGIERIHAVMRFPFARDGVLARGELVSMPLDAKTLPSNKSLEAIGVAPSKSPLAGSLIAIAERARDGNSTPTKGFILNGPDLGAFDVVRHDGFDVTDLAFLPSGDMLLLERTVSIWSGFASRIRLIKGNTIKAGATLDGPVLFEADGSCQIDNMEGLSVHQEGKNMILTMISDDNFSRFQRTVLLEFILNRE